jgi:DNA-binding response OmpR family regulator
MRRSILSINGNRSMNFIVQTVLSPGYNLLPVGDVFQGMTELRRRDDIDLIIVDVDYHSQESLDFIHHVKTSGLYQDRTVIVLASEENWDSSGTTQSIAEKVFFKPFSPEEMVKQIDEIMYQRFEKIS